MTSITDELAQVHNLYMLQVELFTVLDAKELDTVTKKQLKQKLRNFSSILENVSYECMGGEDVYESLLEFRTKVNMRLKSIGLQKKR
jgi:hypothetical protein